MSGVGISILLILVYALLPIFVLYFIIKLAVKKAIKELRDENIL